MIEPSDESSSFSAFYPTETLRFLEASGSMKFKLVLFLAEVGSGADCFIRGCIKLTEFVLDIVSEMPELLVRLRLVGMNDDALRDRLIPPALPADPLLKDLLLKVLPLLDFLFLRETLVGRLLIQAS